MSTSLHGYARRVNDDPSQGGPNGRPDPSPTLEELIDDSRREMIEPMALALSNSTPSLSRMAMRFYSAMFLYQELAPFSAKTLCTIVDASTASGSLALRALEQAGMIFRTRPIGSRTDVYDLVDETQYGQLYAERYLGQIPTMEAALKTLPEGSKSWLRISSAIDLFQCLAEEVPKIFVAWQDKNAARYGR